MKRELSDSETDDLFDDKSSPSQSSNSCQMLNRKKRRGIIEKKRRDRINNSLTELRRLVPTAFEKQGSAKLEKAEILQMTVDHLKMLHAKGFDAFSFDPHKYAADYHGVGFRECASEVARYLVNVEGLDIQDPLRLRLMSHLQCFSAQRDHVTTKSSSPPPLGQSMAWNHTSQYAPSTAAFAIGPIPPPPPPPSHSTAHHSDQANASSTVEGICYEQTRFADANSSVSAYGHHQMRLPTPPAHTLSSMAMAGASSNAMPTNQPHLHHHHLSLQSQYPVHLSSSGHFGGITPPTSYSPSASSTNTQVKPYRPWGTEMAY